MHRETELDDLQNSGLAWGALVDPHLALISPTGSEELLTSDPGPLRLLAAPPRPAPGSLLEARVARALRVKGPDGGTHLVLQADLADWECAGHDIWHPSDSDCFDAEAALLAERILRLCGEPDSQWFEHAAKARAELGPAPRPYPFSFTGSSDRFPIEGPIRASGARCGGREPTWGKCFRRVMGWLR